MMTSTADYIFDTGSSRIQEVITEQAWMKKEDRQRLAAILDFVRNAIPFGMNKKGALPASAVLEQGFGQAVTKSILLKTLLDACGLLNRFHAFRVSKGLYAGLPGKMRYKALPDTLISAWIEIFHQDRWYVVDGVLLDEPYLRGVERHIGEGRDEFIGLGAGIYPENRRHEWTGDNHSYCQRAAIVRDLGIIDDPDWFFEEYRRDLRKLGRVASRHTNHIIRSIRKTEKKDEG